MEQKQYLSPLERPSVSGWRQHSSADPFRNAKPLISVEGILMGQAGQEFFQVFSHAALLVTMCLFLFSTKESGTQKRRSIYLCGVRRR
ncbi:hypothetical protein TNCT_739151 [Trichonephila clavata]|uniref:Uncharacterized protein n=1 Tax=Trichonephila clavata TaxID=2740835 RepID=A0A8X6L1N9_TRICU|nr:hypothetical protein TNCT_739151 [Trichonephila clavata]